MTHKSVEIVPVNFQLLHPNARKPTLGSEGASGYDLYAPETTYFMTQIPVVMPLGLAIELPVGYQAMLVGRSSAFTKRHLVIMTGIIDSDYRGEIKLSGFALGVGQRVESGERIAQLIISRTAGGAVLWHERELTKSKRGSKGFGSTGR